MPFVFKKLTCNMIYYHPLSLVRIEFLKFVCVYKIYHIGEALKPLRFHCTTNRACLSIARSKLNRSKISESSTKTLRGRYQYPFASTSSQARYPAPSPRPVRVSRCGPGGGGRSSPVRSTPPAARGGPACTCDRCGSRELRAGNKLRIPLTLRRLTVQKVRKARLENFPWCAPRADRSLCTASM